MGSNTQLFGGGLGQGKFLQTRDLPKTTAWGYHPEGR